jgi:Skp family chaperone for outer membrane proteins
MDGASRVRSCPRKQQGVLNVKKSPLRATLVAGLTLVALFTVVMQAKAQGTARPAGTTVAVIDLDEVFRKHKALSSQLEQLKADMQQAEATVREERKKIETLAEQLKTLKPGSPDYEAKEKSFASMNADIQVKMRQKSRELLEREAQLRYDTYQNVLQAVSSFADQYNIQLVIRFSRDQIEPDKPRSVQMGLARPIVYQRQLDITDHIINIVNSGAGATAQHQGTRPQIPR